MRKLHTYVVLSIAIFIALQIGLFYKKIYLGGKLYPPESNLSVSGNGRTHTLRTIGINLQREYISDQNVSDDNLMTVAVWDDSLLFGDVTRTCKTSLCKFVSKEEAYRADFVVINLRHIKRHLNQYSTAFPVRNSHHKLVLLYRESPANMISSAYLQKYAGVFNFTAHYSQKADAVFAYGECVETAKRTVNVNFAGIRTKFAMWMASNCKAVSNRRIYVKELRKYIHIDIYGKCGTLKTPNCHLARYLSKFDQCKKDVKKLISQYKFYLAFENSFCEDYITEKAFIATREEHHPLPVMMGGGDYDKYFPPDSYLDVRNFSSPGQLAAWMLYLDQNDEAYNSYFKWKTNYSCSLPMYFCALCKALGGLNNKRNVVYNLQDVFDPGQCVSPAEYFSSKTRGGRFNDSHFKRGILWPWLTSTLQLTVPVVFFFFLLAY